MAKIKYNIVDEYGRLIEKNVTHKRAKTTVKANPGSKLIKSNPHTAGKEKENDRL